MPEKIMSILEKIVYFIFLNILWIAGVLTGGIFAGFLPSSLTAQMMLDEEDFYNRYNSFKSITKRFMMLYKVNMKDYWKLSIFYSFIFVFLIFNLNLVFNVEELSFLIYITVIYAGYILVHFLYLLPVLPLTYGSLREKLKLSLLAPLLHLKVTCLNILLLVTAVVLILFYPVGLFLIYPVGLLELSRRVNTLGLKEKKLIKYTE